MGIIAHPEYDAIAHLYPHFFLNCEMFFMLSKIQVDPLAPHRNAWQPGPAAAAASRTT